MNSQKKITGVILAGGKNIRMGKEKGLLVVDGKRIVERIIKAMKPVVNEIMIISNNHHYDYLGLKVYSDIIPDCGAMSGIHTALSFTKTEKNLIVACDMPFLNKNVLKYIIENSDKEEISVPEVNRELQPLCALYATTCRNKFSELLALKKLKMKEVIKNFSVNRIRIPAKTFGNKWLINLNNTKEYEQYKS